MCIALDKPHYRNTSNLSHYDAFRHGAIRSLGRGSLECTINQTESRRGQVNSSYHDYRTRLQARDRWHHWPYTNHPRGFPLHFRSSYCYTALLRTCRASRHGQKGRRLPLHSNLRTDQSYVWLYFQHTSVVLIGKARTHCMDMPYWLPGLETDWSHHGGVPFSE